MLIVDDDADFRALLRNVLEERGHVVLEAANGRAALDLLRDTLPLAILLDLWMPVMDGWQVLDAIAADDRLRGIPIVVVTGAHGLDARRLGVSAVLRKPVTAGTLIDTLVRVSPAIGYRR